MSACMYMKVFIHPANLCLLVGTFNPFTFNIIVHMYDLISVFLIVLGLFCVGIFHVLCFLPRKLIAFAISSVHLLSHVRLFATPWILSTPGLPIHHPLPEFTQTHVNQVRDAIQPSHPLSSPSPPAPNPSQHQGLFQWVNSLHEVAKVLEFQLQQQSSQLTPRTDLL